MDRFIIKEPRVNVDYTQENQMIAAAFSSNLGINNNMQEGVYYGGYGAEFPVQHGSFMGNMGMSHVSGPQATFVPNVNMPGRTQSLHDVMDPRYLGVYNENNASYITGQRQQMKQPPNPHTSNIGSPYMNEYENRNFVGADRNNTKAFAPQASPQMYSTSRVQMPPLQSEVHTKPQTMTFAQSVQFNQEQKKKLTAPVSTLPNPSKTPSEDNDSQKKESFVVKTRADKIRDLHKSGARAFTGPVEKVLKWHKSLQDLGLLVLYEIVAKCVSVRPGETSAKHLVIRDDSGPAMQVVYYEIDFLLPELKPPCTIRVIGRMLAGSCRLQAFNVRQATGDDVATLPRRAAVAAHHVAKLCKEYGIHV